MSQTKSTKINFENTPENVFPFSFFEDKLPSVRENTFLNNLPFLEKRSEMNSARNDSPGQWIRNSSQKENIRNLTQKKVKKM